MNSERNLNAWVVRTRTSRKITFDGMAHDVRTSKGRASLDADVVRVLRNRKKDLGVRTLVVNLTNYYSPYGRYDRNLKIVQESADRLVVAGKILPVTEEGYLIPC